MPEYKLVVWQVPIFESSPQERMGWTNEAIQDGDAWVEKNASCPNQDVLLKLLGADGVDVKFKTSGAKIDLRKFVETISDVKEIATFGTGNVALKNIATMFNKGLEYIYRESQFPRQSRKALQWAVALRRGYVWPRFYRDDFGWGEGKIEFKDLGPLEVAPVQIPSNNDIQGSYAVTIHDCLGIAEAHARFPRFQEELVPVAKGRPRSQGQVRRQEFWDKYRYGQDNKNWDSYYCEFDWTFIRDLRINRTGETLKMGDPGSSWYYEVPSVGSQIVTINPTNMLPQSRVATEADCRVYPQLRLIISNPGMSTPLYDGPAFSWHGMMPPVPYDVDDWPWMAVGYSLLADIASVEVNQRRFIDKMYRVSSAEMKPMMGYDLNAGIPREDIKRLDILQESENDATIGTDGDPRKALQSVLPDSVRVTGEHFKLYELMQQVRQNSLGLNDIAALAKLKFNLSSDNVDKLIETIGPIAKGIANNMQASHAKIAHMCKFEMAQNYTSSEMMAMIGPDNMASGIFDKMPESLVPSHLEEESGLAEAKQPSNYPELVRARRVLKNIKIVSVPSFLLNVTAMQEKMMWINGLQRGWPLSFSSAFKKIFPELNWADPPGDNELEKYQWEQKELAKVKLDVLKSVQGDIPPGGDGGPGKGKGGGRPPSGKEPPKQEMRGNKSGNPRVITAQSK